MTNYYTISSFFNWDIVLPITRNNGLLTIVKNVMTINFGHINENCKLFSSNDEICYFNLVNNDENDFYLKPLKRSLIRLGAVKTSIAVD